MRTDLKLSFNLDRFYYHNDDYEWTNEMPYFWFSFFKIDGTGCRINENLELEGNAVVYHPFNNMVNLSNIEADKQDIVRIPESLSLQEITLTPIPVPDFVSNNNIHDMEAHTGCMVVLMNENCALSNEKNNYCKILQSTLQNSLNNLIPVLSKRPDAIQDHLENLKNNIENKIISESRKNQSFWKRLTTESIINTTIWTFSSDEIQSMKSVSLTKYWGIEGIWELSGSLKLRTNSAQQRTFAPKQRKKQKISVL